MMRFALILGVGAACGLLGPIRVLAADQAGASPVPAKPVLCSAPEYRQFDFWIGDWEVRDPAGKIVGRNRIASIHNGCALQESWTGNGNFTGTSLNSYDADRRQWHQTWVDSGGSLLKLDGGIVAGGMVLRGEAPAPNATGGIALQKISWTPQPDGRVRQHWETSTDGGKTWSTAFDGMYSRRP
ncbi:MAG: hypothetical protein ACHP7M_10715 [Burkholderiales bacterium]|jgi:hypothetical protein